MRERERDAFIDESASFNFSIEFGFEPVEELVDEPLGGAGTGGDEDGFGVFKPIVIQLTSIID